MIEINNLVKTSLNSNWIKKVVQKSLNRLKRSQKLKFSFTKAKDGEEISVALVGDKEIKKINKDYRGINRVTDVLSFEEINEIIICYPQAKKQAREKKHSTKKEIEILLIHGLLHLAGYDHQRKRDVLEMERIEKEFLNF